MVQIANEFLIVSASLKGGELTHVIYRPTNQELLYQGDGIWPHQDVVMFPIIGKVCPFEAKGKTYQMENPHGFLRNMTLTLEEQTPTSFTLSYVSTPLTLEHYPYAFRFLMTVKLDGPRLIRSYRIMNLSGEDMPFQFGDHAAYQAKFGQAIMHLGKQNLFYYPRRNDAFVGSPISFPYQEDWLLAKEDFRRCDTILLEHPSKELSLSTGYGYRLTYHFSSPYIALWSPSESADFLCVEPWWGMAPYEDRPESILDWKDINLGGKESVFEESISFEKE